MAACKGVVVGVRINTGARSGQATECPVGREWLLFDHGAYHHISFALGRGPLPPCYTVMAIISHANARTHARTLQQSHNTFALHLKIFSFFLILLCMFFVFFLFIYIEFTSFFISLSPPYGTEKTKRKLERFRYQIFPEEMGARFVGFDGWSGVDGAHAAAVE